MLLRTSLLFFQAVTSTPAILVPITAHSLKRQSIQSELVTAFEGQRPWKGVSETRGEGPWGNGGRGGQVTSPSLVPWPVMAGPLSTLHYASALRQMEWSRIQLQKNKQVGSVRLRRSIVSITARAQLYCNCNVIWKTHFLWCSMKESRYIPDVDIKPCFSGDRKLKTWTTLAKPSTWYHGGILIFNLIFRKCNESAVKENGKMCWLNSILFFFKNK